MGGMRSAGDDKWSGSVFVTTEVETSWILTAADEGAAIAEAERRAVALLRIFPCGSVDYNIGECKSRAEEQTNGDDPC